MYKYVKRLLDIILAILILIPTAIPMIIIAILIKKEDGGPAIFKQIRIGKDLKPFWIYKFRTMIVNREELDGKLTHDQMVTKIGKVLRRTSLDELPQILNVLKGDMSFIGPRPWIEEYYTWMTDVQKRRNNVLPGISGLAQVKGRNGIPINRKIEYDLEYVNHFGFKYDFKIFLETIKTVFEKTEAEITEKGISNELFELKSRNKRKVKVRK